MPPLALTLTLTLALAVGATSVGPGLARWRAGRAAVSALDAAGNRGALCGGDLPAVDLVRLGQLGPLLASWQTVGGCGAGASSGTGAGVKWIGRNVTGGLFRVECQANYIDTPYGYNLVGTTLVSRDLTGKWNLGVSVPYLYKYMRDPYGLGFDVANRGIGDVNALLTRRLGTINDTSVTLSIGAPTGTSGATLVRDRNIVLPQDRQLGLGKPTAALVVDHTLDHLRGASVIGALVSWRGGEKTHQIGDRLVSSYRAPSATAYAYTSYLLGPFAPAAGLQLTGFSAHDRSLDQEQVSALFSAAANLSVEWASDWVAVLLGASLPYQYDAGTSDANGRRRSPWGWGPWTLAVGLAFAPF